MIRTMQVLAGIALLGGCGSEPVATEVTADIQPRVAASAVTSQASRAAEARDLAALRAATGRFHNFATAFAAGHTFLFMNMCMVDESADNLGGMGYHYVDTALLDGTVDVRTPEAILYEPQPNGQLRLVGVEYVIPKDAWTSEDPPVLFGRELKLNAFDLWALHVWIWEDNPSGMFADWNPRVTCDYAPAATTASHH